MVKIVENAVDSRVRQDRPAGPLKKAGLGSRAVAVKGAGDETSVAPPASLLAKGRDLIVSIDQLLIRIDQLQALIERDGATLQ